MPREAEQAPQPSSWDINRIEATGNLTGEDIKYLLEIGAGRLPSIEGGTMAHGKSEAQNRQARTTYLSKNLEIEAKAIPHPLKEGKNLPERLVADVLVDIVTACQTAQAVVDEFGNSVEPATMESYFEIILRPLNQLMQPRRAKGLQVDTRLQDGRTLREIALAHNYAPARGDNLVRAGYYQAILEVFEQSLLKRK